MKIPIFVLSAVCGVGVLLESWTLSTLVDLKADVAAIKAQLHTENNYSKK